MKRTIFTSLAALAIIASVCSGQESYDLSTFLMKSTFMLSGEASAGTCFLMGRPSSTEAKGSYYVLVTADHVLRSMKGDSATLHLRRKTPDGYEKLPITIQIRKDGKELWYKHPVVDVAVVYVAIPSQADVSLVPYTWLATDDMIKNYEIHPGDTLYCLGFPFAQAANEYGFPIQRAGSIASYPLLPTLLTRTFLFDFSVYKGNSGGPVFMVSQGRYYKGAFHTGEINRLIMGLVTEERNFVEPVISLYEQELKVHPLKIGVVIHASFIREAVEALPNLDKKTE